MNKKKIAFRVDNALFMGLGHTQRCLYLAYEIRRKGYEVVFICRDLIGSNYQLVQDYGFEVMLLTKASLSSRNLQDHTKWLSVSNQEDALETLKVINNNQQDSKNIKIPLCSDEEFALDLISLSKKLKISSSEIMDLYLNKEYFCYMTGFIAGMPFLGDINEKIRFDRLQTPRIKVPKGSIGITEQFCNIYTFESPGGWNIIGNTPIKVFNKLNINDPSLIKPGDKVSFYKISKQEYLNWNE